MNADNLLAGVIAVDMGLVSESQLEACLREQEARLDPRPIGEVFVQRGLIQPAQLEKLLTEQRRRLAELSEAQLFGQVALARGFVTPAQLGECVREQLRAGPGRPMIGQLLLKKGYLSRAQFRDIIESQGKVLYQCPTCRAYSAQAAAGSVAQAVCPKCRAMLAMVGDADESTGGADEARDTTAEFKVPLANLGKFQIQGEIARGAMGIVFKAHDATLDRVVALKVLKEGDASIAFIRRLHREAALAAKLRHENIVTVHEVGEIEGLHYLCMDFIEGSELIEHIRRRRLVPRLWLRLMEKIARAVHYAHTQGIIHRDLKPSNILVTDKGVPFIMDFGLAKQLDDSAWLTKEGTAMGTPYYMPPEQVLGRLDRIDQRSDVYSLGVIMYEIIAGTPPFTGQTLMEIYQKTLTHDPVRPSGLVPGLDPDLEAICLKAMEKEREHRYSTAEDLAFDIGRFLQGEPIIARRATAFGMLARRLRKMTWKIAAVAGAVLATLAVALVVTGMSRARRIAALEGEAQAHYDAQRWSEARAVYERIVALEPGHGLARERIGEVKVRFEQEKQAAARTAVEQFTEERKVKQAIAKPFFVAGTTKKDEAHTLMHQPKVDPTRIEDCLRLAVEQFSKAIEKDPEYADAHYLRGLCLSDLGNADGAEADFTRVIELAPNNPGALFERGRINFIRAIGGLSGNFSPEARGWKLNVGASRRAEAEKFKERALADFARATDIATSDERFTMMAYTALAEGDCINAVVHFARSLAINEVNPDALFGRGFCHLLRGETDLAVDCFERAVQLKPNLWSGYTALGLAHTARGDLEASIPCFKKTVELGDPMAINNLASVYALLGRYDQAIEMYDLLLKKRPGQRDTEMARASVLFAKGDLRGAVDAAERLIEKHPQWGEPYELAAICYAQTGAGEIARSYLKQAIELDPGNASALGNYAVMLLEDDKEAEALEYARRALEADPSDAQAHNVRGAVFGSRGQWAEALAELERALEAAPNDGRLHMNRGRALMHLRRYDEAIRAFEEAARRDPEARPQVQRLIDEARRLKGE